MVYTELITINCRAKKKRKDPLEETLAGKNDVFVHVQESGCIDYINIKKDETDINVFHQSRWNNMPNISQH